MESTGKLSIIGTPIGNLEDITLRALRMLREADEILCEDTRVTMKLLSHYEIKSKLTRCDAEKELLCAKRVCELLKEDKKISFVSDAGTPSVSDPGSRLVLYVREHAPFATIEAVPGPSSITTALSIAGLDVKEFTFLGYAPHKKGRETFFNRVSKSDHTIIFLESTHRIMKTLTALSYLPGNLKISIARELTKMHEEFVSGSSQEVFKYFDDRRDHQKGEFVVIVSRHNNKIAKGISFI